MIPRVIIPFSPLTSQRTHQKRSNLNDHHQPSLNILSSTPKSNHLSSPSTSQLTTIDTPDDEPHSTPREPLDHPPNQIKLIQLPPSSPPILPSSDRPLPSSPSTSLPKQSSSTQGLFSSQLQSPISDPTNSIDLPQSNLSLSPSHPVLDSDPDLDPNPPLNHQDIAPKSTARGNLPIHQNSRDIRSFFSSTTAPNYQDLNAFSSSPTTSRRPGGATSSRLIPSTSRKATKNEKGKRAMSQLVLDISNRPTTQICPDCGMSYVIGVQEDLELHKKHHRRVVEGLEWSIDDQSQSEVRVVWRDHSSTTHDHSSAGIDEDRIIKLSLDPQALKRSKLKNKVQQILEMVNYSLDAQELTTDQLAVSSLYLYIGSSALNHSTFIHHHHHPSKKQRVNDHGASLITKTKKKKMVVKAMCVAARIQHAYQIVRGPGTSHKTPTLSPEELLRFGDTTSELYCSPRAEEALIGIHRIWTSPIHRRRGLAERLLESVSMTFIYGLPIQGAETRRRSIAFSQPTESGMRLASKWFETILFRIFID